MHISPRYMQIGCRLMKHPLDVEKRRAYARMQICKFVTKQTEEKAVSCRWSAWDVVRQKAVKSWGPRRSLFSRSDDEGKEQKKKKKKKGKKKGVESVLRYSARFKHASYNTRRERERGEAAAASNSSSSNSELSRSRTRLYGPDL